MHVYTSICKRARTHSCDALRAHTYAQPRRITGIRVCTLTKQRPSRQQRSMEPDARCGWIWRILLQRCICSLNAWCLLRTLCVEVLLSKLLQCTQSFSSSCAFETFTKKGLTRYTYCRAFLFLCSLSLAAITSPTDTVGEVIRVPGVALAKTSFLCLPLFLASAWCLL